MDYQFNVGDQVTIVDPNATYDTFKAMFIVARFKNTDLNPPFDKNSTAKVIGIYFHPMDGTRLYALEQRGKQCIVNGNGIKPYDPTEDLFVFSKVHPYEDVSFTLTTSGTRSPLMIGVGLVDDEYQGKCLVVDNDRWTMNVKEDRQRGLKILTFKQK